jgi:maltose alpha-D-glucosyltransferase/alpha-amylase
MHNAFEASHARDFEPETANHDKLKADADRLQEQIRITFALIRQKFSDFPEENVQDAALVLSQRKTIEAFVDRLASLSHSDAGVWTRIHGDFHLGQVLRTDSDFVILDFEGEPVKPLEERRKRQSPLRDVAGMARSLSYVASVFAQERPDAQAWATEWQHSAVDIYLKSYFTERHIPFTPTAQLMLNSYVLEKALYELQYELNHRPTWANIPLKGILKLL